MMKTISTSIACLMLFGMFFLYTNTNKENDCLADTVVAELSENIACSDKPNPSDSVLAILLSPYIDQAIQQHFGEPMQYALYDAKVESIAAVGSDFVYKVVISVPTFYGPHNPPYGLETLTFIIKPGGSVILDAYKHTDLPNESYQIKRK